MAMTENAGAVSQIWERVRLLRESPVGVIGAFLVAFWVVVALFAPLLAPFEPNASNLDALGDPTPSAVNWLGVDMSGRDILTRIIWGSRTVLSVAPVAVFAAYALGCLLGLLAGYYRGWVDNLINRVSDIILSFPAIVLYIIVIMRFGPSAFNIVLAVIFIATPQIMRIVRGMTLELREREYVAAAKMRGESALYIMFVEILPNARGPLIVDACLRMGYTTIAIGVLGFLGLGLPPPDPDWGGMVKDSYALMSIYPHMALFPAAAITSLVVGFSLLADGMREISMRD
ncbi:MAG: ABC transporter permease [Rhodospirillaceae bacterium]|jgi:peptide/nickel transport system permease protein|nr:ABC transporter permease [Rhodospirillaceae bacterium]